VTTGQRNKQLKLSFEKLTPAQVHSRDPSHSGNVSAHDRAKQFKETTHKNCDHAIQAASKVLTNILHPKMCKIARNFGATFPNFLRSFCHKFNATFGFLSATFWGGLIYHRSRFILQSISRVHS